MALSAPHRIRGMSAFHSLKVSRAASCNAETSDVPKKPITRCRTSACILDSPRRRRRDLRLTYASSRGNATLDGKNLEEVLMDHRQSDPITIDDNVVLGLFKHRRPDSGSSDELSTFPGEAEEWERDVEDEEIDAFLSTRMR